MNAIDKIDTEGARSIAVERDAVLLALFAKYQAACADRAAAIRRPFSDPRRDRWVNATWRREFRLADEILATPAHGVAGIAAKLATSSPLVLTARSGDEHFDRMHEPLRAALRDALRLSGVTLSHEYVAMSGGA